MLVAVALIEAGLEWEQAVDHIRSKRCVDDAALALAPCLTLNPQPPPPPRRVQARRHQRQAASLLAAVQAAQARLLHSAVTAPEGSVYVTGAVARMRPW